MQSETLRIAFATPEYVTEKHFDGGLPNYLGRVARALSSLGHDIHVVTLSHADSTEFEHEGVMVHRVMLNDGWQLLNCATRYRLATTVHWLNLSTQVYRKLKQLSRQKPFHLIQFPNHSFCGLVSMLLLQTPHVLRLSSYEPLFSGFQDPRRQRTLDFKLLRLQERLQARLSPYIYAPSRCLQKMLIDEDGIDRVRVVHTPMYLETNDWDSSVYDQLLKDKNYLLFFGRLERRKGVHILAQALVRVLEENPNMYAVLVGRDVSTTSIPSMAGYVRSLCNRFGDRLMIVDSLSHRQLYPIIASAKLIVLPSLADNMPNACLEAMALGKPVVGTTGTSFDEVITNEKTGFLVSANNIDALAETIIYAWTHPKLQEIGNAAQQKILEFSPEKTINALLSYYQEVLQN
jgi:glycogen(starch) synthase